jgi:hypothetical protein
MGNIADKNIIYVDINASSWAIQRLILPLWSMVVSCWLISTFQPDVAGYIMAVFLESEHAASRFLRNRAGPAFD